MWWIRFFVFPAVERRLHRQCRIRRGEKEGGDVWGVEVEIGFEFGGFS